MSAPSQDRKLVLWLLGAMFVVVVATALLAPNTRDDDPAPNTYNSGARGWKGAYLLLQKLGYSVRRSEQPASAVLDAADAAHTTYFLSAPNMPGEDVAKNEYEAVERFLRRGGRVIAAGSDAAAFLPGGRSGSGTQFVGTLCNTVPEGSSIFANTGMISTYDVAPWTATEPLVRVDARCGADAVLVHRDYAHGGRMLYLASPEPFSNRGLKQDNALHLLLLVVGPANGTERRAVIFDEFYHGDAVTPSDYLKGLPLRSLSVQALLVILLLLFSYTRRSGPVREPLAAPRTSPLEFAESMGALYERAGASQAATEAARRRLISFLIQQFGIPAEVAWGPVGAVAAMVAARSGADTTSLQTVLERAYAARYETLRPRDTLSLVRDMNAEMERLRVAAASHQPTHTETK